MNIFWKETKYLRIIIRSVALTMGSWHPQQQLVPSVDISVQGGNPTAFAGSQYHRLCVPCLPKTLCERADGGLTLFTYNFCIKTWHVMSHKQKEITLYTVVQRRLGFLTHWCWMFCLVVSGFGGLKGRQWYWLAMLPRQGQTQALQFPETACGIRRDAAGARSEFWAGSKQSCFPCFGALAHAGRADSHALITHLRVYPAHACQITDFFSRYRSRLSSPGTLQDWSPAHSDQNENSLWSRLQPVSTNPARKTALSLMVLGVRG